MKPSNHKKRILKLLMKLRAEICMVYEEHHVKFPEKDIHEIELDIHKITQEIERTNFIERKKDGRTNKSNG